MLVLSRKPNQKIQIGSEITVTVVKVRGNVIRLGIEAPRDVRVIRSELELRVDESLTAGIGAVEESGSELAESSEGASEEPGPRSSQVSIARYTRPRAHQGLASVMKKKSTQTSTTTAVAS